MNKDAFIARWKKHMAGLALYGVASETRDGPLARAAKVLDIPAEVESLLGKMYDDVAIVSKKPETNGHAPAVVPMRKAST